MRGGTPAPQRLLGVRGDDITAGGGCGTHCAVREGSSGIAVGNFGASRSSPPHVDNGSPLLDASAR